MDDRRRLQILLVATAGAVLIPLNTSMLSVGLAPLVEAFSVTNATGTWLVLLYLAAMTSLQPTAGKLGDRFGHRRMFIAGLVVFGVASAAAAMASSFGQLVFFRALQGVSGAALAPNASALIRFTYPPERQGYAMGLYVSVFSIGLTAGPVVSGMLIHLWGWPAMFWVNLPCIALATWFGLRLLPGATRGHSVVFDWWGTAIFSSLIILIVLAANLWREGRLPWPGWFLAAVVILSFLFWRVEERAADPLLRFSLFRLRGFGTSNAAIFLLHSIMYAILVAVPLFLQQGRGVSPSTTGLVMSIYSLVQVLISPLAGRLSDRLGRRLPVIAGGLLYVAAAGVLWGVTPQTPLLFVVGALAAGGVGTGLASAPIQAAALAEVPPELVGVGAGVWYSSRYLGNIGGALLTGLLLPQRLDAGAGALYAALAAIALLLALTATWLPGVAERADA